MPSPSAMKRNNRTSLTPSCPFFARDDLVARVEGMLAEREVRR